MTRLRAGRSGFEIPAGVRVRPTRAGSGLGENCIFVSPSKDVPPKNLYTVFVLVCKKKQRNKQTLIYALTLSCGVAWARSERVNFYNP